MPVGSVEIALSNSGWNGDFLLTPTGDLQLVTDQPSAPNATMQRLIRLILTNPRLLDPSGNPIAIPNDRFNPTYGAGVRALVGQAITSAMVSGIQSRIIAALLADPDVATNPPPNVSVTQSSLYAVSVSVICYAVSGEIITIPSLQLPIGS